jgi:Golgi SNAP receptor complex protein 1
MRRRFVRDVGRRVRYGGDDEESATTTFESVRRVEEEIARLRSVNEEMEACLRADDARARGASARANGENNGENNGGGGYVYRDSREHTLQRHREVLQEYDAERGRLRRDAEEALDRERLLGGVRAGQEGSSDESVEARLIRERARVAGSTSAVDDIIGVAQNTARELFAQRGALQNAGAKLMSMTNRVPVLNNLILAIKKKKNKDAVILAAVVAACTTFVLLYYLSK